MKREIVINDTYAQLRQITCGCKLHGEFHLIRHCSLHAAAPELLEAAKIAIDAILKNGELSDALVKAHNALDKAVTRAANET